MSKKPKSRPRDANKLAFQIVQESVGEAEPETTEDSGKDPAAVALGRKGGLKGGRRLRLGGIKKLKARARLIFKW